MGLAAWAVLILTMLGFWTAVVWIVLSIIRGSTLRGSPSAAREVRSGARGSRAPMSDGRRHGRRAEHQSRHFHRNDRQEKVLLTDHQEERR